MKKAQCEQASINQVGIVVVVVPAATAILASAGFVAGEN